jgi:nucleotide-binding universal stress UspA family protein
MTRGAQLRIVSCYRIPAASDAMMGWSATEAITALLEATEIELLRLRSLVAEAHPGLEITTTASPGPAGDVLVLDADPEDLIVVGASSHAGAAAFWLGSTPRHVVRHSPCAVVVVRGAASRGKPDRIVVGVDGSEASDQALRWAGNEADRHGVELVVVHGWSYPYLLNEAVSSQARDLTEIDAACVLERSLELAREQFAAPVTGQLVEQSATSALLASVHDGDVLVVGSSGRGAVSTGLFGSTVNSVLDRCAVPVVVVPTGKGAR